MAKTVVSVFSNKSQTGDIGIEVEVEGRRLPKAEHVHPVWRKESDSSLRGESAEYVFYKPLSKGAKSAALDLLRSAFRASDGHINDSYRAGVHVHINVQSLNFVQLFNYVCLYLMFEECLIDFCAPSRRGNHFCLRVKDADYLSLVLLEFLSKGDVNILGTEDIRYASINLYSLFKYGSVEFRALETPTLEHFDKIDLWSDILLHLRNQAITFNKPTDIIGNMSNQGFLLFAKETFGPYWEAIAPHFSEEKLRKGVRNIQHIAYARDWSATNRNIFQQNSVF